MALPQGAETPHTIQDPLCQVQYQVQPGPEIQNKRIFPLSILSIELCIWMLLVMSLDAYMHFPTLLV